jgi:hypothetical protein
MLFQLNFAASKQLTLIVAIAPQPSQKQIQWKESRYCLIAC